GPRRSAGTLQLSTRCSSLALPPSRSLAMRSGPARMLSPACDGTAANAIAKNPADIGERARRSKSESNIAKCVVCQQTMDKWDSANAPIYKLIHRPEDA